MPPMVLRGGRGAVDVGWGALAGGGGSGNATCLYGETDASMFLCVVYSRVFMRVCHPAN